MGHRVRIVPCVLLAWGCAVSRPPPSAETVRPGIDVLISDSLHLVLDQRVGLLTNQTGVDAQGRSDIERLLAAGVRLTALFSPEHGFRGGLNQDNIDHSVDSATGLPIYSLYGTTRAPTPAMLSSIDRLVIDLQDIGARTYTYVSTALLAIQAAGQRDLPVVILDRPNPVGGVLVQGPVLDSALRSFVGMLPVPLRHGMTLGELVHFGREALQLPGVLTVVPAAGWRRDQWFDATGLPWIRPSPSMPDLESATHYPGIVLFEATNLSVGRGTAVAFQIVGAPWLDAAAVVRRIGPVTGVAIRDTTVSPQSPPDGKYAGIAIPAVRFSVENRSAYDPTQLAVRLLVAVRARHTDSLVIDPVLFDQRAGTVAVRQAIELGRSADEIWRSWSESLEAFSRIRERHLLYR